MERVQKAVSLVASGESFQHVASLCQLPVSLLRGHLFGPDTTLNHNNNNINNNNNSQQDIRSTTTPNINRNKNLHNRSLGGAVIGSSTATRHHVMDNEEANSQALVYRTRLLSPLYDNEEQMLVLVLAPLIGTTDENDGCNGARTAGEDETSDDIITLTATDPIVIDDDEEDELSAGDHQTHDPASAEGHNVVHPAQDRVARVDIVGAGSRNNLSTLPFTEEMVRAVLHWYIVHTGRIRHAKWMVERVWRRLSAHNLSPLQPQLSQNARQSLCAADGDNCRFVDEARRAIMRHLTSRCASFAAAQDIRGLRSQDSAMIISSDDDDDDVESCFEVELSSVEDSSVIPHQSSPDSKNSDVSTGDSSSSWPQVTSEQRCPSSHSPVSEKRRETSPHSKLSSVSAGLSLGVDDKQDTAADTASAQSREITPVPAKTTHVSLLPVALPAPPPSSLSPAKKLSVNALSTWTEPTSDIAETIVATSTLAASSVKATLKSPSSCAGTVVREKTAAHPTTTTRRTAAVGSTCPTERQQACSSPPSLLLTMSLPKVQLASVTRRSSLPGRHSNGHGVHDNASDGYGDRCYGDRCYGDSSDCVKNDIDMHVSNGLFLHGKTSETGLNNEKDVHSNDSGFHDNEKTVANRDNGLHGNDHCVDLICPDAPIQKAVPVADTHVARDVGSCNHDNRLIDDDHVKPSGSDVIQHASVEENQPVLDDAEDGVLSEEHESVLVAVLVQLAEAAQEGPGVVGVNMVRWCLLWLLNKLDKHKSLKLVQSESGWLQYLHVLTSRRPFLTELIGHLPAAASAAVSGSRVGWPVKRQCVTAQRLLGQLLERPTDVATVTAAAAGEKCGRSKEQDGTAARYTNTSRFRSAPFTAAQTVDNSDADASVAPLNEKDDGGDAASRPDSDESYVLERVLCRGYSRLQHGHQYLVKWRGHTHDENTWESANVLRRKYSKYLREFEEWWRTLSPQARQRTRRRYSHHYDCGVVLGRSTAGAESRYQRRSRGINTRGSSVNGPSVTNAVDSAATHQLSERTNKRVFSTESGSRDQNKVARSSANRPETSTRAGHISIAAARRVNTGRKRKYRRRNKAKSSSVRGIDVGLKESQSENPSCSSTSTSQSQPNSPTRRLTRAIVTPRRFIDPPPIIKQKFVSALSAPARRRRRKPVSSNEVVEKEKAITTIEGQVLAQSSAEAQTESLKTSSLTSYSCHDNRYFDGTRPKRPTSVKRRKTSVRRPYKRRKLLTASPTAAAIKTADAGESLADTTASSPIVSQPSHVAALPDLLNTKSLQVNIIVDHAPMRDDISALSGEISCVAECNSADDDGGANCPDPAVESCSVPVDSENMAQSETNRSTMESEQNTSDDDIALSRRLSKRAELAVCSSEPVVEPGSVTGRKKRGKSRLARQTKRRRESCDNTQQIIVAAESTTVSTDGGVDAGIGEVHLPTDSSSSCVPAVKRGPGRPRKRQLTTLQQAPLSPSISGCSTVTPAANTSASGGEVFPVERVMAQRYDPVRNSRVVLVKWLGYSHTDNTWEPAENLAPVPSDAAPGTACSRAVTVSAAAAAAEPEPNGSHRLDDSSGVCRRRRYRGRGTAAVARACGGPHTVTTHLATPSPALSADAGSVDVQRQRQVVAGRAVVFAPRRGLTRAIRRGTRARAQAPSTLRNSRACRAVVVNYDESAGHCDASSVEHVRPSDISSHLWPQSHRGLVRKRGRPPLSHRVGLHSSRIISRRADAGLVGGDVDKRLTDRLDDVEENLPEVRPFGRRCSERLLNPGSTDVSSGDASRDGSQCDVEPDLSGNCAWSGAVLPIGDVEAILARRRCPVRVGCEDDEFQLLIKWRHFDHAYCTWESEAGWQKAQKQWPHLRHVHNAIFTVSADQLPRPLSPGPPPRSHTLSLSEDDSSASAGVRVYRRACRGGRTTTRRRRGRPGARAFVAHNVTSSSLTSGTPLSPASCVSCPPEGAVAMPVFHGFSAWDVVNASHAVVCGFNMTNWPANNNNNNATCTQTSAVCCSGVTDSSQQQQQHEAPSLIARATASQMSPPTTGARCAPQMYRARLGLPDVASRSLTSPTKQCGEVQSSTGVDKNNYEAEIAITSDIIPSSPGIKHTTDRESSRFEPTSNTDAANDSNYRQAMPSVSVRQEKDDCAIAAPPVRSSLQVPGVIQVRTGRFSTTEFVTVVSAVDDGCHDDVEEEEWEVSPPPSPPSAAPSHDYSQMLLTSGGELAHYVATAGQQMALV